MFEGFCSFNLKLLFTPNNIMILLPASRAISRAVVLYTRDSVNVLCGVLLKLLLVPLERVCLPSVSPDCFCRDKKMVNYRNTTFSVPEAQCKDDCFNVRRT